MKCGKWFTQFRHLQTHGNPHEQKLFQCQECLKSFVTAGQLKVHLKSHTNKCLYTCMKCDKRFIQLTTSRCNGYPHETETPYMHTVWQVLCSKDAPPASPSNTHWGKSSHLWKFFLYLQLGYASNIHTGEKQFACQVDGCSKRFVTRISSTFSRLFIQFQHIITGVSCVWWVLHKLRRHQAVTCKISQKKTLDFQKNHAHPLYHRRLWCLYHLLDADYAEHWRIQVQEQTCYHNNGNRNRCYYGGLPTIPLDWNSLLNFDVEAIHCIWF